LPAGASGAVQNGGSDKKTLHCVIKATHLLPLPLPLPIFRCGTSIQADPPRFGGIVFDHARLAAATSKSFNNNNHARN
jgi:hypothetical protein